MLSPQHLSLFAIFSSLFVPTPSHIPRHVLPLCSVPIGVHRKAPALHARVRLPHPGSLHRRHRSDRHCTKGRRQGPVPRCGVWPTAGGSEELSQTPQEGPRNLPSFRIRRRSRYGSAGGHSNHPRSHAAGGGRARRRPDGAFGATRSWYVIGNPLPSTPLICLDRADGVTVSITRSQRQ